MSEKSTITCPDCQGKKVVVANLGKIVIDCYRCAGSGLVDSRSPAWIREGSAMKAIRIKRRAKLINVSRKLSIPFVILSNMELGIIKPKPEIYKELK
jgi:hypothetical protein